MPMAPVRQDTRVPLIPGMNPQLPVGLPDANGYYPGDDRYGGGFTRGPGGYQRPQLRPQLPKPNLPNLKPNDSRPALPVAQTIQGRLDALNPGMPSMQEYLDQRPGMPRLDRDFLYRGAGSPGGTPGFYDREMAKVNPIRPGMDDGRAYAGGSPGLYAPGGRFNPGNIGGRISDSSYSPLELAERKARARVEAGKQDLFQKNRKDRSKKQGGLGGLFRKLQEQIKNQQRPQQMPQQNLDFLSRLPQNMMPQVDFSNLPQMSGNPNIPAPDGYELREDEKGMNYFREQLSPEDQAQNMLPRRLDVPFQDFNLQNMRPGFFEGRDVNIDDGGMVDFLNSNPEQVLFGIENRIGILQNQLEEAKANRDRESFDMIVQEINNADAQRIEIMNSMKPNPITQDFQQKGFDKVFRALLKGGVKGRNDSEIAEQQKLQNLEMQMEQQQAIDDMLLNLEKKN
jgi:hypothetical protein